jgi:hypothetical protein
MMRTTMNFIATGTSKAEIETNSKQLAASYFGVDVEHAEEYIDIEISVHVENGNCTASGTAKMKKNYDTGK